jgi:hypothetical protein
MSTDVFNPGPQWKMRRPVERPCKKKRLKEDETTKTTRLYCMSIG